MSQVSAIIITCGAGKCMNGKKPGILREIAGKPMINHVLDSVRDAGINDIFVVAGEKADVEKSGLNEAGCKMVDISRSVLKEAVISHCPVEDDATFLFIKSNMPFVKSSTIKGLAENHRAERRDCTLCVAPPGDEKASDSVSEFPFALSGRAFRAVCESAGNSWDSLNVALKTVFSQFGTGYFHACDREELFRVDDMSQLAEANNIMRRIILDRHMAAGVVIIDTTATYIDADVKIGQDTVIYPGTILEKGTVIGDDCTIGPNSRLIGSIVGDGSEVTYSVVIDSTIGKRTRVGPFAYIRPESKIGDEVRIGDFVEIKKSVIGKRSKVSHLTYVGDADVGENVNLGCGVVFVNYDGKNKNRTVVKDNAFIGCNVNLVAPVTVHENAYIAAGSTITEEVPAESLAIARSRQTNKPGWVVKKGLKKTENK